MNKLVSMALAVMVTFIVSSSAHPEIRLRRYSCGDGRLCQCRRYLDADRYRQARNIVQCLHSLRTLNIFSRGAAARITRKDCKAYNVGNIKGSRLIKCVWAKIGLVRNIHGVDQWDLEKVRENFMNFALASFPDLNQEWVRRIIIDTFRTCYANPRDFNVVPFEDCWPKAEQRIRAVLEQNRYNQNLADDDEVISQIDDVTSVTLNGVVEDMNLSNIVDVIEG